MTPTPFDGQNGIIAKDQPDYLPLPAHITRDGTITCCWNLTWRERIQVFLSGRIWHSILTFNKSLQPQMLYAKRPDTLPPAKIRGELR